MDDLLDIDWSGKPQKPASNTPPAKPHKPSYLSGNPMTRVEKPQDAFAGLLNLPSEQKEPPLSLAEQQRRDRVAQRQSSTTTSSWPAQTLPTSFSSASPSLRTLSPTPNHSTSGPPSTTGGATAADTFDSLLDPFGKQSKARSSNINKPLNALKREASGSPGGYFNQSHQEGQWNFDLLESKSTSSNEQGRSTGTRTPAGPIDPFDMDALSAEMPHEHSTIPDIVNDDDNPLGILAGPSPATVRTPSPPSSAAELPTPPSTRNGKDMLVAQLVDMGFNVEQAQVAVEATGGKDLQEAIDLLVQNTEAVQAQQTSKTARARNALFADREVSTRSAAKAEQRQQPKRRVNDDEQRRVPSRSEQSEVFSPAALQQHKEKLVAQATELGGFLYKNASIFVKTGRERINKAVETWQEQQRTEQLRRQQGRPRWMTQTVDEAFQELHDDENGSLPAEKFVDDDSSDENPEEERKKELAWRAQQEAKRKEYIAQMRRQQQREDAKLRAQKEQQEQEEVYVSPSRRRAAASRASTRKQPVPTAPQPTPIPVRPKVQCTRPVVTASSEALSCAHQAREKGNEQFKLGQFGEAEAFYTQAIMELPSGHDHLVILYNNRAAARLKIGEYKKCIEDCTMAIDMAKASGEDNYEAQGITIQWKDQIAKGLSRKAEAFESIEKYSEALKVYEELIQMGGSHSSKASQGLARCRKALNPPPKSFKPPSETKSSPSKPKESKTSGSAFPGIDYSIFEAPAPVTSAHVQNSKAVADLRAQAAQQEADEAERLSKTDDVNARITNWKAGKEQNLRALLATLDTLLWPGAQWRGAQMSELINPKRCKMVYLKAIAKVHPDKLPSNVTIEQRMLASSIFSTLNEAWDIFKAHENV